MRLSEFERLERTEKGWVVFTDDPDPQCFFCDSILEAKSTPEANWPKGKRCYIVGVTALHQTRVGYWD